MNLDKRSRDNLTLLAEELALNYFDVSFDFKHDDLNNERKKALAEEILGDEAYARQIPSRNIVIIGAGASKSSHNLKTAKEAITYLNKKFGVTSFGRGSFEKLLPDYIKAYEKQNPYIPGPDIEFFLRSFEKRYAHEKDKLVALMEKSDPKEIDFESHLALLAHFFSIKDLRQELAKLYNYKFHPSPGNTVLAHLIKHRFIDAIINFNFDELLDEIIREQLKGSDYHEIISDGHCQEMSSIVINNRMKVPVYIKPHGTVSHRSTMKFTKDDYFGIPQDLQTQLEDLIGGSLGAGNNEKPDENSGKNQELRVRRVNLICIGFAMRSVEFNNIIKAKSKGLSELKIYFFDTDQSLISEPHVDNLVSNHDHRKVIHLQKEGDSFGYAMRELWGKIEEKFSDEYKPRGIWESEIVTRVFHDVNTSKRRIEKDVDYFLYRVFIEVVIAICKGKGKVYLSALVKGNSGKYYELFVKEVEKSLRNAQPSGASDKEVQDEVQKVLEEVPAFSDLIEDIFGFENQDVFSRDRFGLDKFRDFNPDDPLEHRDFLKALRGKLEMAQSYFENRSYRLLLSTTDIDLAKEFDNLKALFSKLVLHTSRDIRPRFSDSSFHIYSHHHKEKVLNTKLALKARLMMAFKEDWDLMLVVGERGGLLRSIDQTLSQKQRCAIIVAEESHRKLLHDKYNKNFVCKNGNEGLRLLPYWAHDYHMCLFLKRDNDWEKALGESPSGPNAGTLVKTGWDIVKAVYYPFNYNTDHINPIYLEGENLKRKYTGESSQFRMEKNPDRLFLTRLFYGYYLKSGELGQNHQQYTHLTSDINFDSRFESWLIGLHDEFE